MLLLGGGGDCFKSVVTIFRNGFLTSETEITLDEDSIHTDRHTLDSQCKLFPDLSLWLQFLFFWAYLEIERYRDAPLVVMIVSSLDQARVRLFAELVIISNCCLKLPVTSWLQLQTIWNVLHKWKIVLLSITNDQWQCPHSALTVKFLFSCHY